jgi:hypothetical protein
MLVATGLLVSRPLLPEPHLLGETRACGGVVRRNHGIIAAETPLLAILLWCEVVTGAHVPLERLEFLSVPQGRWCSRERLISLPNRGPERVA